MASRCSAVKNCDFLFMYIVKYYVFCMKKTFIGPNDFKASYLQIVIFGCSVLFHKKFVVPSQDRLTKMLIQGHNSARVFLQLFEITISCLDLIPNARLYMRPIQFLETKITKTIAINPHLITHLQWWLHPANISKGRPV